MTNNVKTLIKMLNNNGFTVDVYSDDMIIVNDVLNRLSDLFAVYGKSQFGTTTIDPCGVVDYHVDSVTFTYLPF